MTTYQQLKRVAYIGGIIAFAESLLGIRFKATGSNHFSGYCPFHADTRDSFRIYVNEKEEVRFHCFGACQTEWDVYDLIMLRNRCGFAEAQSILAKALGVKDFMPYDKGNYPAPEVDEPDEPVSFLPPPKLDENVIAALSDAAAFYHHLLRENPDRFSKVVDYLNRRGVDVDMVDRFQVGYAPALSDEDFAGRALIDYRLERFKADWQTFNDYKRAGLVRLLNDGSCKAAGYYSSFIDFSRSDPFSRGYADYFAGRITFPIYDIDGRICGFMGRKTDNRRARWIKQTSAETAISTKGWLYGIDKAARWISHYRTVVIVEGIFDYFAFYRLLQDAERPVILSTLGTDLDEQAEVVFKSLGVKKIIIAFDWDVAGRQGIRRISEKLGGQIFYLGGMKPDEDPADKLKRVVNAINGYSLKRLIASAKESQKRTEKPVMVSFLSRGTAKTNEVIFKPDSKIRPEEMPASRKLSKAPEKYFYERDRFLPLLTYNNANRSVLDAKIQTLIKRLNESSTEPLEAPSFHIYTSFIKEERYDELGPALILWLRLAIEQQRRKRRVKETDSTIADWLQTSRQHVSKYKSILRNLGYPSIDTGARVQKLSVRYSPK